MNPDTDFLGKDVGHSEDSPLGPWMFQMASVQFLCKKEMTHTFMKHKSSFVGTYRWFTVGLETYQFPFVEGEKYIVQEQWYVASAVIHMEPTCSYGYKKYLRPLNNLNYFKQGTVSQLGLIYHDMTAQSISNFLFHVHHPFTSFS